MCFSNARPLAFFLAAGCMAAATVPGSFPRSGNGLWYTQPAQDWTSEYLPIGNGYLAAMLSGGTSQETIQLNIESLWAGGPFQDPSYNGTNQPPSARVTLAEEMKLVRREIFSSRNGTIADWEWFGTDPGAYGSYTGAGYMLSSLNATGSVSQYFRWLDLDSALARSQWTQNETSYSRTSFCSQPLQACIQHINTTAPVLPELAYSYSQHPETGLPVPNVTCFDNSTIRIRGFASDPGMLYEILARVQLSASDSASALVECAPVTSAHGMPPNATLSVTGAKEAWITWVGGTNYDMNAGDAAHSFTFQGSDPHGALVPLLGAATKSITNTPSLPPEPFSSVLAQHVQDFSSVTGKFSLSLGEVPDFLTPTDALWNAYQVDVGNPYLEWITFNYARYLLASSSRGSLPANLQGKWASDQYNAWNGDYHANINLQMNYWAAEMTNLDVTRPLFNYIEKTWAPRGTETAQILYNISRGWVTHNEMNIFGATGMKNGDGSAEWANYPESSVWMMVHVWDHFDFTGDTIWWKAQGWPLLKAVAEFHLDKLVPDEHFHDSSLVVVPCNSPEQAPITFGCAHAQQLIWQLFNAVEKGFEAAGDNDQAFLSEVQMKRSTMDKGIHIGSWQQLQEWKFDMDARNDTHRHLSHLVGLYPGYAVANFNPSIQGPVDNGSGRNYSIGDVLAAATTSLIHRGNGTGADGDAGWEKVWRAAAWAQLGNASMFYHELSYALQRNFGPNLFSLYSQGGPFQIDANLGFPAAVLNALVQAPDVASWTAPLTVTLLPALPRQWPSGRITGARLRGGMTLNLEWSGGYPTLATIVVGSEGQTRTVRVTFAGKVVAQFMTGAASTHTITF
ncbi:glycoside hydrolase family 95 protein [Auriscalpium vulgare]|uniref:Glycoside hydrolase family 95 protein n=1 Tax=Auriscalpium vulgare TaxID=40419 RepID=A0ACB8S6B3_9AGAM|nr:glycoside hydrolase family 95 protein [Auriscalpium vulgare]